MCATEVNEFGVLEYDNWAVCGPDCPMDPDALITDETLKVTHHREVDQKQIMISVRLIGVMSSSLSLLALMMKGLGISGSEI